MCIILTCNGNVRPDYELVESCFYNNPDGAGIMWCDEGRVQIAKGFADPQSLMEAIESVPVESPLVIHMRIATSGGIDVGTCHPFPVCNQLDVLHAANVECDVAIAHNGVIAGVPTDNKLGISDTVYFVSHFVNNLLDEIGEVNWTAKQRIKRAAPGNRFAIMTSDGSVFRLGSGWETVTKGIEASNDTWRWNIRWSTDDYWYYDQESGLYEPVISEYEEAFQYCCGDCSDKAACIAYGPLCNDVADFIDAYMEYGPEALQIA